MARVRLPGQVFLDENGRPFIVPSGRSPMLPNHDTDWVTANRPQIVNNTTMPKYDKFGVKIPGSGQGPEFDEFRQVHRGGRNFPAGPPAPGPQGLIPRPPVQLNRSYGQTMAPLGSQIMGRAAWNFGDMMQGAMGQMAGMNLANQQASQRNKDLYLQWLQQQQQFKLGKRSLKNQYRLGKMGIESDLEKERIKSSALGKALGLGGQEQSEPMRYTSNIGQGARFYNTRPRQTRMPRQRGRWQ